MDTNRINIGQLIMNNATDEDFNVYPNIDKKYGPYSSLTEALNTIELKDRAIGLTFGVKDINGNIIEYWFNKGISNKDVVVKNNLIIE